MQFQWNFAHTLPTRARIYYTRRRCSAVLARRFFGKSNIQNCCPAGLLSMQLPLPPALPPPLQQPLGATTPQLSLCPRPVIYYFTLTRQTFLNSSTKQRHFCTTHSPALLSPLSPRNNPSSLTVLSEFSRTSGLLHLFAEIVVEKLAQLMKF